MNGILQDIEAELQRARALYPGNGYTLAALAEEVGELNTAMLRHARGYGSPDDIHRQAVQVAAMAIRVAEEGDAAFPYRPAGEVIDLKETRCA